MKKSAFLICCFITAACISFAQQKITRPIFVSAVIDVLIPNAEFGETHRTGIGATVEGGYRTGRYFAPVLTFSYYAVPADENSNRKNLNAVSFKTGARAYLGNFYLTGEGGAIITSGYATGTRFIYSAGIGDEIKISSRMRIDIGVRYESFRSGRAIGVISAKAGLTYTFGIR